MEGKVKLREKTVAVGRPISQPGLSSPQKCELLIEMQRIHDMNNWVILNRAIGELTEINSRAETPRAGYANILWEIEWESKTKTKNVERQNSEISRLKD